MNNRDRFPEVDDVEGLAAAATKHLDFLKQKKVMKVESNGSKECESKISQQHS